MNKEIDMVWMSTERKPLFTVEMSDKFDGVYFLVKWQNGVFGALGREEAGPFYSMEEAEASLPDVGEYSPT